MDVVVVGRRAEERWSLAAALGQPASHAMEPQAGMARLAHPAVQPPAVVVLIVRDEQDLAWCAVQTRRAVRRSLPVVAAVVRPGLVPAARAAGAVDAVLVADPLRPCTTELTAALDEAASPGVVLSLGSVQTTA